MMPDLSKPLLHAITFTLCLLSLQPLLLLNGTCNAFPTASSNIRMLSEQWTSRKKLEAGVAVAVAALPDPEIREEIRRIAEELWDGEEIPTLEQPQPQEEDSTTTSDLNGMVLEGEAELPKGIPYEDRGDYFRDKAIQEGCPKAQHSYGLLLWNGFCVPQNAKESAKFHAAAALQNHFDGIAALGGCIRTGTGLQKKNVALGLHLIDYCASQGNPSGINKKGALLESNQNDYAAVQLYEESLKNGRVNALLLFNLGWSLVINGQGVDCKDVYRGIDLWKQAAAQMVPDEGSEEAAWHLYQHYDQRDNPTEAMKWRDLAEELGYSE